MTKDKITDKYIKAVQKQFKHYHTTDARFISDLKDAVISYAAQQDSLDYEQLVSQFGDPQELVNDYFSEQSIATVYKGNIIKNLIMDCQSYTKYRPNETTGGIFVSWRRKEELPTGA